MNRLQIFADNLYTENATVQQWNKLIFRNFDRAIKFLVGIAKDNKCMICKELSLNYQSSASLGNHLQWVHRKRTVEYFRDNIMTLTPDEIEEKLNDD